MSRNQDNRTRSAAPAEGREPRGTADAIRTEDDGTALTREERRAMIRSEFQQEALPSVPSIPGWHLCWLSTTNSYDPIHKRMRLGYTPVKAEELPGFDSFRMGAGQFEGAVSCNEMVLFKVPEETYQAFMREFHHDMPREEEEALKARLTPNDGREDKHGRPLVRPDDEDEGFNQLVQRRGEPARFA